MTEQDKTNNSDKELSNTKLDSTSIPKDPNKTTGKEKQNDGGKNENSSKEYEAKPIIVYVPKQEDPAALEETRRSNTATLSEARKANRFTRIGIVINTILVLFTLGALWFTKLSVDESKRANDHTIYKDSIAQVEDSAKSSEQNKKDSVQTVSNRKRDSLDSIQRAINYIKDSTIIALTKQSAQAQTKYATTAERNLLLSKYFAERSDSNYLKSIQIASNSFDISKQSFEFAQKSTEFENKPFVFMSDFHIDSLIPNKPSNIQITVKNFGRMPTVINEAVKGIAIDTAQVLPNNNIRYTKEGYIRVGLFTPVNGTFRIGVVVPPLSQPIIDMIKIGKLNFFVFGEVSYQDFVFKRDYIYAFCYRVTTNAQFVVTPNHNNIYIYSTKENKKP